MRAPKSGKAGARVTVPACVLICLLVSAAFTGCGQSTPEQTVYKFLGAVQSQDMAAMRSCVNPEALAKAGGGSEEIARQWEELNRRYLSEPVNWRMEFEGIHLEASYLEQDRALVRIAGGRCSLYGLRGGAWTLEGELDFSRRDFTPFYMIRKDGRWYMEALHLYMIYGLEEEARA